MRNLKKALGLLLIVTVLCGTLIFPASAATSLIVDNEVFDDCGSWSSDFRTNTSMPYYKFWTINLSSYSMVFRIYGSDEMWYQGYQATVNANSQGLYYHPHESFTQIYLFDFITNGSGNDLNGRYSVRIGTTLAEL